MTNHDIVWNLKKALTREILGQEEMIDAVIIAMLTNSHLLIEGVPGLGKTQIVLKMAEFMYGHDDEGPNSYHEDLKSAEVFKSLRPVQLVQFIPDMQPADLIGGLRPEADKDGNFKNLKIKYGKIFTHLFIADEINRAPSKVQAALLQVMQNRKVSMIETDDSVPVNKQRLFSVFATQNPLEEEGTYPLSEAFLDRFLFKVQVAHPVRQALDGIAVKSINLYDKRKKSKDDFPFGSPFFNQKAGFEKLAGLLNQVNSSPADSRAEDLGPEDCPPDGRGYVAVADYIQKYAVDIIRATYTRPEKSAAAGGLYRSPIYDYMRMPVSPRALESLLIASRGSAFLNRRDYVTPSDIQEMAYLILPHRFRLSFEAMSKKGGGRQLERYIVDEILNNVRFREQTA